MMRFWILVILVVLALVSTGCSFVGSVGDNDSSGTDDDATDADNVDDDNVDNDGDDDDTLDDDFFDDDGADNEQLDDDSTHDDDSDDDDTTDDDVNDDLDEHVWIDSLTGLMWQNIDSPVGLVWDEAKTYCNTLVWSGYNNWHLPTISELRSLVRGCPETMRNGSCGVKDDCLSFHDCYNESCKFSDFLDGPASGGAYWPIEMLLGWAAPYWSDSEVSDMPDWEWHLDFRNGWILYTYILNPTVLSVRCVR